MKSSCRFVLCLLAIVVVAGCASTNVTQQTPMSNPGLAKPNQIFDHKAMSWRMRFFADDGAKGHRLDSRQRESTINRLLTAESKLCVWQTLASNRRCNLTNWHHSQLYRRDQVGSGGMKWDGGVRKSGPKVAFRT